MSSTTRPARRPASRRCSPKQQINAAVGEVAVFLSLERTTSIVDGVKMPGAEGVFPSVLKISSASTAQEMALYAIGVARKHGDHNPSSLCVQLILKGALPRIS